MSIGEYLEQYTYETLLTEALSYVPDTIDKREGSIIYDAIAPACYVLAEKVMLLKDILTDTYALTASGEYLDNRVAEQGISRYPATYATRKGVFTTTDGQPVAIPIGSRFSTIDDSKSVNFYVESAYVDSDNRVETGSYRLVCEEAGTIGNGYVGPLLPITNISGLATAQLTTILAPARDIETDEELRSRYLLKITEKAFGGNVAQYDLELKDISGVGEVQIYPVWNGGGTVLCSVVDAEYNPVSDDFIANIQQTIDPSPQGTGLGLAPIGHTVTITTPTEKVINISTTVAVDNRYTVDQLKSSIINAIEAYLLDLRKVWGVANELNEYSLAVYISRINAAILSVTGVSNASNITINNSTDDLILMETAQLQEIPVLGEVTINE